MKSAIIILALALTTSAHALTVGDSATYLVVLNGQSHSAVNQVTAIDGDQYTVTSTIDGTQTGTSTGSIANLDQLAQVVQNCAAVGGTNESLTTPAGTFNTCHVSQNGEEVYIAAEVTFGVAKVTQTQDGNSIDMTIQSFVKQ